MKKTITIIAILLLGLSTVFAQKQKSGFSFQFAGILPFAQFDNTPALVIPGTNSFHEAGGAMFGASFGIKYTYSFEKTSIEDLGLGIFFSVDAMWNALQKDIRIKYDNVNCTKPMYINAPVMIGVSYTSQFSDVFGVWAEAGIGADLFYKTAEGWEKNMTNYRMNVEFAAEGGAGIILARTVTLGAHYYWLGNHDVRAKNENALISTPNPLKVGVWAFKLGFHF